MRSDISLDGAAAATVSILLWIIVVLAATAILAYAARWGLDTPIVRRVYDVGLAVFTLTVVGAVSTAYLIVRRVTSTPDALDR